MPIQIDKIGFTPGPWEPGIHNSIWNGTYIIMEQYEGNGGPRVPEDQAIRNTRLIAAAPEMLKHLENIINAQYNKNGTLANLNSTIWNARDYLIKLFPELKDGPE